MLALLVGPESFGGSGRDRFTLSLACRQAMRRLSN
jgi:hypothetical protein